MRDELMHHDHLHIIKWQPVAREASLENQLDDLPSIEVPPDKFRVRLVLLQRHD
jgi:hypothetical protein